MRNHAGVMNLLLLLLFAKERYRLTGVGVKKFPFKCFELSQHTYTARCNGLRGETRVLPLQGCETYLPNKRALPNKF